MLEETSNWKKKLKTNRRQLDLDLLSSPERRYFSPVLYSQYQITLPLAQQHVTGRLLDVGCGDLPFRDDLIGHVTKYDSLDLFPRSAEVTYSSDIQDMASVPTGYFDSAICLEVLEHVGDPFRSAREIYRVLAPGGVLIVSVPHLSRLHDEPHDYFRYTKYGLEYLLLQAGFSMVHLEPRGGLFSFVGHQISSLALSAIWPIRLVREIFWFLNSWLVTRLCFQLDLILDPSGVLASGYTAVAIKPDEQHRWRKKSGE